MHTEEHQELVKALAENRLCWDDESVQSILDSLRSDRRFLELAELTEKAARFRPKAPKLRRLQAQALIETGQPASAISVIEGVRAHIADGHSELPELQGLLGRAYKQIFVEARGASEEALRFALEGSVAGYRSIYQTRPDNYWHGVNLLALSSMAQRRKLMEQDPAELARLANQVSETAKRAIEDGDDLWAYATMVEVAIATNDLDATEAALRIFLAAPALTAFHVGSLLRQLVQVWQLDEGTERAQGILTTLRAKHACMPGADSALLSAAEGKLNGSKLADLKIQFERILGPGNGLVTFEWWKQALQLASGVAAVRNDCNRTIGTAFVIAGESLLEKWTGATLALTNFHVVNRHGVSQGLRPQDAELVFEAVDSNQRHRIKEILWESPPHQFDCALLLLDPPPPTLGVVSIANNIPLVAPDVVSRVFVIGHPNGRGLEFSVNDNELLDHDEETCEVTRLHYRAPTEGGSSGSPVFKEGRWQAIAIHHGYTEAKLKGKAGTYRANEGIGLKSLKAKLAAIASTLPDLPVE